MKTRRVDVAIIGAGSAGLNARRQVEKAGGQPLLIESGPYGTTCARVGCMPSKLLIAAADAAGEVADAGQFGIAVSPDWSVNGVKVMQRVRSERDRFVDVVIETIEALPAEQRLRGHARFIGPNELEVDGDVHVTAKAIVIATGSSPFIPPPFNSIREHVLINDDIFELPDLPKSMAVIGTGVMGLELGQALQKLGVHVVFFSPFGRLGPFTDPEVIRTTNEIFANALELQLNTEVLNVAVGTGGIRLHYRDSSGTEHEKLFEKVLVTAGRRPNIADLDLDRAGVGLDEQGQPNWNPLTTQLGNAPIFLAGDANDHLPLLHEASDEGRIAGANAMLYPNIENHVRRTPLAIAFTDPQIAMVGKRFDELETGQCEIGEVSFANQGRARVIGKNRGLLRIYADKKDCAIMGAEMLGPQAEHLAHLLAWVAQERMSVNRVLRMPFYHPVLEEGLRTALVRLARKLRVTGDCPAEDFATAPGN